MAAATDVNLEMLQEIGETVYSPVLYAERLFPWPIEGEPGPRKWQKSILRDIETHLCDPETRKQPCQIAVSSGHGIGKSALVAMVMSWALSTCEDCKIVVTANTATQLATKTVPRVEEWFRRSANVHWWDLKATSITFNEKEHARLWRADYVPWSENNTEAFAGLHNQGKRIVLVFDEASGIADKVWEVAEGALTDSDTEIIWLAFGNPTQNTGRFRECFGKFSHRWKHYQIDSRQVEGTNKAQIEKWIEDYGEDSDFVRVRVRGEFPRAGTNQFIPSDAVAACRKYKAEGYQALARVLSIDVARFGDDQSVIGYRQGRKSEILKRLRGLDTVQVAQRVIEIIDQAEKEGRPFDGMVIDGDGLGAGTIDYLRLNRYHDKVPLFEFHGNSEPADPRKYYNKRAEVWGLMRDAIKAGMEIPDDPELETDLTGPYYGFSKDQQIQLEKKEDMKKRGLASPDNGDMLAMTFGVTVLPRSTVYDSPEETFAGAEMDSGWMR